MLAARRSGSAGSCCWDVLHYCAWGNASCLWWPTTNHNPNSPADIPPTSEPGNLLPTGPTGQPASYRPIAKVDLSSVHHDTAAASSDATSSGAHVDPARIIYVVTAAVAAGVVFL
ncbi:Uncharacterized protein PBTT_08019 [Plasmodiophora brassicae]